MFTRMFPLIGRVNFKKNEKTYDAEKSAVFKVLQEAENDPEPGITQGIHVLNLIYSIHRIEIFFLSIPIT